MFRASKNQNAPAANLAVISERFDAPTVAAAWPRAMSPLERAIEACRRNAAPAPSAKAGVPSLPTFWSHKVKSAAK